MLISLGFNAAERRKKLTFCTLLEGNLSATFALIFMYEVTVTYE